MSDTYSYEVLEPGGHARLVGNVLDRISRASANPASAVGSAAALLGDAETASWIERTTAADGAALVDAIYGNTIVQDGSLLPVRMEGIETVAADESWSSTCAIPVATYFPDGMRSAGSVRDELRADAAITRVGAVDLGTLTWIYNSANQVFYANPSNIPRGGNIICSKYETSDAANIGAMADKTIWNNGYALTANNVIVKDSTAGTDAAAFKTAMSGVMLHYALATPTTQLIDPPLPMSYRVGAGGTERVMVASGTQSAPPIFVTRYPLTPEGIRDRIAATVAPVEQVTAQANHAIGELVYLGWSLYKVTIAIATGETITPGTNVTETTVAAELAALSE